MVSQTKTTTDCKFLIINEPRVPESSQTLLAWVKIGGGVSKLYGGFKDMGLFLAFLSSNTSQEMTTTANFDRSRRNGNPGPNKDCQEVPENYRRSQRNEQKTVMFSC